MKYSIPPCRRHEELASGVTLQGYFAQQSAATGLAREGKWLRYLLDPYED